MKKVRPISLIMILLGLGIQTLHGCNQSTEPSKTKAGIIRGPEGRTHVFFESPANSQIIIARQCSADTVIRNVGDIERICPGSENDRRWHRERFVEDFKDIFYLGEMYEASRSSDHGDILDYDRDFAESAPQAKEEVERKLQNFRILLEQAQEQGAQEDARYYERKIREFESELERIDDVAVVVKRFNRFIGDLVDKLLSQTRVFTFFRSANENHRLVVDALYNMHERGPTEYLVYCRVCKQHYDNLDPLRPYTSLSYECDRSPHSQQSVFENMRPCHERNSDHFTYETLPEEEMVCFESEGELDRSERSELFNTCEADID